METLTLAAVALMVDINLNIKSTMLTELATHTQLAHTFKVKLLKCKD